MSEITYIVRVDAKGIQRLCLEDGTPIPAQVDSDVYQNTEQAMQGICTFNVLVFCIGEHGEGVGDGIKIKDNWNIELPDGRICAVDRVTKCHKDGVPAVYISTMAKLLPTI